MKRHATGDESTNSNTNSNTNTNQATTADGRGGGRFFGLSSSSSSSSSRPKKPATPAAAVAVEADTTEAMLVEEWNQLTFQERERVQEELHGVTSCEVQEDPEIVEQCLLQVEEEIKTIRKRNAYDRALFLSPKYVKDRDFRMMFLRADNFQPREAANRIVRFFEFKQDLFGIGKMVKRIELEDLEEEDQEVLKNGNCQFLPQKDQSGRTVLIILGKCTKALNQVSTAQHSTISELNRIIHSSIGIYSNGMDMDMATASSFFSDPLL
jgi:hypothetical protein